MSVAMFLKMDGITGDSKNYDHKGWSDVVSWSWGLSSNRNSAQLHDDDMTSFKEISISKRIGMDSTDIMLLFALGKSVKNVELNIIPVVGARDAKQKYLSMLMEDVVIKSITTGGSTAEDFFKENIVLLFDKIRFVYNHNTAANSQNPEGTSLDFKFGWDISMNQSW
jgi:type VI secretion system secreted protein Hcp